jgi:hypothetical protein
MAGQLQTLKRKMTAYKKVRHHRTNEEYLLTLEIPRGAQVVLFNGPGVSGRKSRASRATVKKIEKITRHWTTNSWSLIYGTEDTRARRIVHRRYDCDVKTTYTVGRVKLPDAFDPSADEQCTHGIHFFVEKKDALNWSC